MIFHGAMNFGRAANINDQNSNVPNGNNSKHNKFMHIFMIWRKRMHENTLRLNFLFIYYRDQMKNNPTQTQTPVYFVCEDLEYILI